MPYVQDVYSQTWNESGLKLLPQNFGIGIIYPPEQNKRSVLSVRFGASIVLPPTFIDKKVGIVPEYPDFATVYFRTGGGSVLFKDVIYTNNLGLMGNQNYSIGPGTNQVFPTIQQIVVQLKYPGSYVTISCVDRYFVSN